MAQRGRPPGPGEKPWRDAIRRAVNRRVQGDGDPKALDKLAEQLVALGMSGDVPAIKEIGDRLDGKPRQESDVTIHDDRDPNSLSDAELAAVVRSSGSGDDASPEGDPGVVH